jgi:hypothetical protein
MNSTAPLKQGYAVLVLLLLAITGIVVEPSDVLVMIPTIL